MIRFLFALFCLLEPLSANLLFDAPEEFSPESFTEISAKQEVEIYSYKGGLMRILVTTSPSIDSRKGLENFVRGLNDSMKNQNFSNISISETNTNGFYTKRAVGKVSHPNNPGSFRSEQLSIFTSDKVYSLALLKHDSVNSDLVVEDLVSRLSLTGEIVNFSPESVEVGEVTAYSAGYVLGLIIPVVLIVVIAIFLKKVIKSRTRRRS